MIEINLLPHREAKRAADLRQTAGVLVLGLVLEAGLIWFLHSGVTREVGHAQAAVKQLEADIEQYKPQQAKVQQFKAKRSQLEEKLAVIDGLEKGRTGPVRLMDELASNTPDRLWLTGVETAGNAITLEGESLDTGMVAEFLRGLNESRYFTSVDLDRTSRGKEIDGVQLVSFVVTAQLTRPDETGLADAGKGA